MPHKETVKRKIPFKTVVLPIWIAGMVFIVAWFVLFLQQPPSFSEAKPEKKEVFQEARPESEKAAKKPQLPPRKEEAGPTFIKIRPGEVIDLSQ